MNIKHTIATVGDFVCGVKVDDDVIQTIYQVCKMWHINGGILMTIGDGIGIGPYVSLKKVCAKSTAVRINSVSSRKRVVVTFEPTDNSSGRLLQGMMAEYGKHLVFETEMSNVDSSAAVSVRAFVKNSPPKNKRSTC